MPLDYTKWLPSGSDATLLLQMRDAVTAALIASPASSSPPLEARPKSHLDINQAVRDLEAAVCSSEVAAAAGSRRSDFRRSRRSTRRHSTPGVARACTVPGSAPRDGHVAPNKEAHND
jgi:hypothetical protein